MSIMSMLYDQDVVDKMREYETKQEAREEGIEEGIEKGRVEGIEKGRVEGMEKGMEKGQLSTLSRLIKKGIITIKDAASELGMTERTFKKKMAML